MIYLKNDDFRFLCGDRFKTKKWDPANALNFHDKKDHHAEFALKDLSKKLGELQALLYAEHKNRVLIVLQGMDSSGKDGTISHVFEGVNPQGVRVASFKTPTSEEADHDYLWRVHQQAPRRGEIVIFNRSHYEDVLITKVHGMISDKECARRYRQINDFEKMLTEEDTTILKFFLHISSDEQKARIKARLDHPEKEWKFSKSDLAERKFWKQYQAAYEDALTATNTNPAPWFIVPANHKWFRNLVVADTLVSTLLKLRMKYPRKSK